MKKFKPLKNQLLLALTLISLISIMVISAGNIISNFKVFVPIIQKQPPEPTATPKPTETPKDEYIWLIVRPQNPDKDWALAWFEKSQNASGIPIMEIYPSNGSPTNERIKIASGEKVLAYNEIVRADGGTKFWKLVDYKGRDGEDLYLRQVDVMKADALVN